MNTSSSYCALVGRDPCRAETEMQVQSGPLSLQVAEGPVIRLLGTLGQAQAGKPQSLQLEPLEDMMEISAASPAQRLRRRGQCLAQWTPTGQV